MIPRRHLILLLPLLITLLSSCSSHFRSREARKLGIRSIAGDASSVLGTYANLSSDSHGRNVLLWNIVRTSPTASHATDRVHIVRTGRREIQMRLLRDGRLVDLATTPFTPRGNHLHLRASSSFKWLPFGCSIARQALSLSSTPQGNLVALVDFSRGGVVLMFSAGDNGTHAYQFKRAE